MQASNDEQKNVTIGKMFKLLTTQTNTIGKTALLLTIFTISSSFLAVIRDKIFSSKFGAGEVLDTYMAAFKIPDLVFLLTATLISAFVIIPFLEREEKNGQENLQKFINKLFFTFSFFILIVSAVVWFFMPSIAESFFAGFNQNQLENLVHISRIMLLSPIFMGLSFTFSALNQKNGYFFPMALTGVFYNLSIISGALFLYPIFGFDGVVFGVVFGAFLYLLLQIPSIVKEGFLPKKIEIFSMPEFLKILKVSTPRSVALALSDLVLIFLIAQATLFGNGSVTMLNFALNIFMVPIGIIAISYSVATFPKLAKAYAENNIEKVKELSRDVISRILFFGIPISFFFIFFAQPLVGLLLGSEKFGMAEINSTALFVSVLAIAIVFQAISIMTVRIFYAMGRTWLPLLANILTGVILISGIYFLKEPFMENYNNSSIMTEQTFGILFLVWMYAFSFIIGAFITNYFFKKSVKNFPLLKGTNLFSKIAISGTAVLVAKYSLVFLNLGTENSFWLFFSKLLIGGIIFIIVFVIFSEKVQDKNYIEFRRKISAIIKTRKSYGIFRKIFNRLNRKNENKNRK